MSCRKIMNASSADEGIRTNTAAPNEGLASWPSRRLSRVLSSLLFLDLNMPKQEMHNVRENSWLPMWRLSFNECSLRYIDEHIQRQARLTWLNVAQWPSKDGIEPLILMMRISAISATMRNSLFNNRCALFLSLSLGCAPIRVYAIAREQTGIIKLYKTVEAVSWRMPKKRAPFDRSSAFTSVHEMQSKKI